jgi:cell wall-associated NlpC family hydrolase
MTDDEIIKKYLRVRYVHGGRDPLVGLDCWGLILCIYREFGLSLIDFDDYPVEWARIGEDYFLKNYYRQFEKFTIPARLDIALFKNNGVCDHAGLVLNDGKFIHCSKVGVSVGRFKTWAPRIEGFYRLKK